MRIFDLSQTLRPSMQVFPGYPATTFIPWATKEVQGYDSEALFCITHAGTHVDAPVHFVKNGKGIDKVPLESLHTPARRLDLRRIGPKGKIGAKELRTATAAKPTDLWGHAVLLWTGWDAHLGRPRYLEQNPGLTKEGATFLIEAGAVSVGIDAANLDHPDAPDFPAHHVLLGHGVPIIENLTRLGKIPVDRFRLSAVPLNLEGASGSPVRAIAIVE